MPLSMSVPAFRHVVRGSALYDVLVTAPFATPWTFNWTLAQLSAMNQQLGGEPVPAFPVFAVMIACLMGSIVMVWSVLRILDPQPRFGRFDAAVRLLFSTWMAWALAETNAPVLWCFLVPELAWALVQCWPLRQGASSQP